MRKIAAILFCIACFAGSDIVGAQSTARVPIIFDTDFVMPPADDSMALMLALQSPELEILASQRSLATKISKRPRRMCCEY